MKNFAVWRSGTPDTHLHSPNTCYIFRTHVNEQGFSIKAGLEEASLFNIKMTELQRNAPVHKDSPADSIKDDGFLYGE